MAHTAIRIAILACDTPVPAVQAKLGGYGDCFTRLLKAGLAASDLPETSLQISVYDVVNSPSYPDLAEIDALLLTGSKHTAYHNDQWILDLVEYTKKAYDQRKRIIGVCFGHQILARALGARVEGNNKGWEISTCSFDLTEDGARLFNGQSKMTLHQMHRDIVAEVPSGFVNLGGSSVCGIQGFYQPRRAITVQAHPEFNEFIMTEIVKTRHEQGVFGDEQAKDALLRASHRHDGAVAAKAIIKFLFEE